MLRRLVAAGALGILLSSTPAQAGTPITVQVTCPLTGAQFNFETTASYSTWGRELDGLPLGSWTFPLAVPQCPESRFPALEDLSPEALAAARILVETPEYQAIREQSSYYVLAYVTTELGLGEAIDPAWHLLQATWQVRDHPELYRSYAAELVTRWDADSREFRAAEPDDWMWIESYVVNVERQAGRFAEAGARLDALEAMAADDPDLMERLVETRRLIAEGNAEPFGLDLRD